MTRTGTILRSTTLRMDKAIEEFKRQVFGDEAHQRELLHVATLEADNRYEAPPAPEVRKGLIPNWAWNKRSR